MLLDQFIRAVSARKTAHDDIGFSFLSVASTHRVGAGETAAVGKIGIDYEDSMGRKEMKVFRGQHDIEKEVRAVFRKLKNANIGERGGGRVDAHVDQTACSRRFQVATEFEES